MMTTPGPHDVPKRRSLLGMLAVSAVLASGLGIGSISPAQAAPANLPTWQDVENAKQNEASASKKVSEIEKLLVQVKADAVRTRSDAETAGKKRDTAQQQLVEAQTRVEALDTQAEASQKEADAAAEQAAALVSQIYRSGGVDRSVSLFLESDGNTADALLDRLAQTEKATERNTTIWQNAERAMNSAKTLSEQAGSARDERDKLEKEAAASWQQAAEVAEAARTEQTKQEEAQVQLEAQLEALKDKTTKTTKGYQERLRIEEEERQEAIRKAEEEARRAAEEARKAAEEEARRAAEAAANNGGGGGGGGDTGGNTGGGSTGGGSTGGGNPGGSGGVTAAGWVRPIPGGYWVSTEWWGYWNHTGMDLAIGSGTPIYAASAGTVSYSGWGGQDAYGNMVRIDHGGGISTLYGHMLYTPSVSNGQWVEAGQFIGYVGSTGNSTGPHLHFETLINGIPTNPRPFMADRGVGM